MDAMAACRYHSSVTYCSVTASCTLIDAPDVQYQMAPGAQTIYDFFVPGRSR